MADSGASHEQVPAGVDVNTPNVARMYDYYLGGKNHFPADREAAERILSIGGPELRVSARANREFLGRAVRHVANAGIRQFLDVGTGLPTQNNVHEVAHEVAPDAKVVYVDNDPVVLAHGRTILDGVANATIVEGDVRRPGEILNHPEVRAAIDLEQPIALLLVAILHFVPDENDPDGIVAHFRDAMAPGSFLILSHGTDHARAGDVPQAAQVYRRATAQIYPRSSERIRGLFDGFELVDPGLVYVQEWGTGQLVTNPQEKIFLSAVGCKV